MLYFCHFFFTFSGDTRDLHSFPTRRSSDLCPVVRARSGADRHRAALERRGARPGAAPGRALFHPGQRVVRRTDGDRKSTRLNSSHTVISYAVFCLKKKKKKIIKTN